MRIKNRQSLVRFFVSRCEKIISNEIKKRVKKIQQNKCEDEKICDKREKAVKIGRNEKNYKNT